MRKLILLLLAVNAFATTTVSGNLKTLGTGNVSGAFVRFWLRGCQGNQPRINGTGIIAPSQGGVFFIDLPASATGVISGTIYSTRDITGNLGGEIECGGSTTAVWYGMQAFYAGKGGPEVPVQARSGATLDITSITPITTNPVVTSPTGDTTYLRKDAGNNPANGNYQFTGNNTFTGTTATKNLNGRQYADQFLGADFCAKLLAASQVAGVSVVDATGFAGSAQSCGTATNLAASNVTYLLPPNLTISGTAGVTITISGSDVSFVGSGDTTLFDFSSGNSGNEVIHVTGNRVRVARIKINGNRVAGGAAVCLTFYSGLTTFWAEDNNLTNCGGSGITAFGFSDGHISRNRISSTSLGGIFFNTGSSDVWVTENTFTSTNMSNTGGHGGITVFGNSTTFDSGFHFLFNKVQSISGVPFQINSVSALATRITRNVEVIGNQIDTTTLSGEGIAFTANNIRVIGNRINKTAVTGILVFGVPSGVDSNIVIADNIISDCSQLVSGNNYGIQMVYGGASLAKMRITDNIIFDDQGGSATTAGAVNFSNIGGAGTIADAVVSGNIGRGNISSVSVSFSQAADAANVIQFGNSNTVSNNVFSLGAGASLAEGSAPTAIAGQDVCYGDSTGHVLKCAYNNGSFFNVPQTIASGTATMTTGAIGAGACGATVTVAASGVLTTDAIIKSYNAAPAANPAELVISAWPTANNVNFQYCNPTAGSVTPNAATLNWRVVR